MTDNFVFVRFYYVWRGNGSLSPGVVRIIIIQEWIRTPDPEATEQAIATLNLETIRSEPRSESTSERLQEAASDYFAEELVKQLLGQEPQMQGWPTLWPSSPVTMAHALSTVNSNLNELLTEDVKSLAAPVGAAGYSVDISAGIVANFALRPISEPLQQAVKVLELVGLGLAVATGNLALMATCAHDLARQELTTLIGRAFEEALSGPGSADRTSRETAQRASRLSESRGTGSRDIRTPTGEDGPLDEEPVPPRTNGPPHAADPAQVGPRVASPPATAAREAPTGPTLPAHGPARRRHNDGPAGGSGPAVSSR